MSPRRNRVDPFGRIVAVNARGDLMGNRGKLHDNDGVVGGNWKSDRNWVSCNPAAPGPKRPLASPGHYTVLFFLDEATALTAGHRPCWSCRRDRANAFKAAWQAAWPERGASAIDMSRSIYAEQTRPPVLVAAEAGPLPDGAMVGDIAGARAWLFRDGAYRLWSFTGYGPPISTPPDGALLLTRPSMLGVLNAGYRPDFHRSTSDPLP